MVVLHYKHMAVALVELSSCSLNKWCTLHQGCPAANGTFSCKLKLHSGRIANLKMSIGCPDCLHCFWKGSAALMPPKQMVHCAPRPIGTTNSQEFVAVTVATAFLPNIYKIGIKNNSFFLFLNLFIQILYK
jgi:hypothetical protein